MIKEVIKPVRELARHINRDPRQRLKLETFGADGLTLVINKFSVNNDHVHIACIIGGIIAMTAIEFIPIRKPKTSI